MVAGVVRASYLERISFAKHLTDRKFRIAEIRQKSPEKFHPRLQKRTKKKGLKIQALAGIKKLFVVCVQFQAAEELSEVVMDGLPGDLTTDASGNYSGTVDYGWSGTVTPIKAGYLFSPFSRDYTNVTSEQLNQDYTASIILHIFTIAAESNGTTNPIPNTYTYEYGAQVQVTAVPDSGYEFSGWTGDASGTTNPITITMDSDKSIIAYFRKKVLPAEDDSSGKKALRRAALSQQQPMALQYILIWIYSGISGTNI